MHDGKAPAQHTKPQLNLGAKTRRILNEELPGSACAIHEAPNGRRGVIVVPLPRAGVGRAPRRPIHIPLPASVQFKLVRAGKHQRQKSRSARNWERPKKEETR